LASSYSGTKFNETSSTQGIYKRGENNRRTVVKLLIASIAAFAIATPALAQTTPPTSNDATTQSTTTTTMSPKTTHKVVRHHKPIRHHRKHRIVRHKHTTHVKAHVTTTKA